MEVVVKLLRCVLEGVLKSCCSPKQLVLNTLGLSLAVSGVFRFWIPLEPLLVLFHVNPQVLLLFNWTTCILLESYSVGIFQVPWSHIKLKNMSKLRLGAIIVMISMGLTCVCSMWQMCVDVGNCVLESGYSWMDVPLLLAMVSAMMHSIVLGLCVPVQAIVVSMECNKEIPNVSFKQRGVTLLTAHIWLFIHFIYLCVYYSSYHSLLHVLAILYRFCCTAWMIIYCYPDLTRSCYYWLKTQLPDSFRPVLRVIVRDNYLSIKVWRNVRRVISLRTSENARDIDESNFKGAVSGLFTVWMEIIKYIVLDVLMDLATLLSFVISSAIVYILLREYLLATALAGILIVGICYGVRHVHEQDHLVYGEFEFEQQSFYKKYHAINDDGQTVLTQKAVLIFVFTMTMVFIVLQQSLEAVLIGGMVTITMYCILWCYEVYRQRKMLLATPPIQDWRMCSESEDFESQKFSRVCGLAFCHQCYEIHSISNDDPLTACIHPHATESFYLC
ncbi:uncharacterized protein [Dysidea avara]|uniref:uncharacterized protein isoform X2 n=1 Tax=Dysidea avara TaxID=196820 RepID=UPI00331C2981